MNICIHVNLVVINFFFTRRKKSSKAEKRKAEKDGKEGKKDKEKKKAKTGDGSHKKESILDDIRLEQIESRIEVHVIETPEACTHEVAVYPGERNLIELCYKFDSKNFICRSNLPAVSITYSRTSKGIPIRLGSISERGYFVH